MVQKEADLQQLKGVGSILAKRLRDAGYDSFAKIAEAGEDGLKKVRGISPRALPAILEQARQLAEGPQQGKADRQQAVRQQVTEVRDRIQGIAESARQRYQDQLSGKSGKKFTLDLVRIEKALGMMGDGGGKRSKRAGKALSKAEKRVAGLEQASLKKIHKGLKRARKAVRKAL